MRKVLPFRVCGTTNLVASGGSVKVNLGKSAEEEAQEKADEVEKRQNMADVQKQLIKDVHMAVVKACTVLHFYARSAD